MPTFDALPPLSIYIHVPWCVRKCPYCDFNSHAVSGEIPQQDYLAALIRDLEADLPRVWGRVVNTIFIGGGTPSLMEPDLIGDLLSAITSRLRCAPGMEVTMEANPGTLEAGRFEGFRAAGVNRLSIGIQSFDDVLLGRIGRIHDGRLARQAAEVAGRAGFSSFNLDLMFGLPGQDAAAALRDVDTAIALGAPHISHYELTLEPNTAFHHEPPALPTEEALVDMQQRCHERLAMDGFINYEVSAFAKASHQCRHNLNYWQFGDYLGIGAGAHAKITDAHEQCIHRFSKQRLPRRYLETAGEEACRVAPRTLSPEDSTLEFMMNALRLTQGVSLSLFAERTGLTEKLIAEPVRKAIDRGLLNDSRDQLTCTPAGHRYLNDLLALF